ncbi:MAG: LysM domain-containing protein [Polyangiaceae bacterium]|jgi:LysM repeat protein
MERSRVAHIIAVTAVVTASVLVAGTASAAQTPPAKTAPAKSAAAHSYVVKSGDGGWSQLAKAHGTTMPRLLAANHATAATPVKAGQRIQLPAATHAAPSHAATKH